MDGLVEASSAFMGGAFSCTVLYPLDLIKTSQQGGSTDGALEILKKVAAEKGVKGIWDGCAFKAFESISNPTNNLTTTRTVALNLFLLSTHTGW